MIIADEIIRLEKQKAREELEKESEKAVEDMIHSIEEYTFSKLIALEKMVELVYSMEVQMFENLPMKNRDFNCLFWTVQTANMYDMLHTVSLLGKMLKGLIGLQPFVKYVTVKKIATGEVLAVFTIKELMGLISLEGENN